MQTQEVKNTINGKPRCLGLCRVSTQEQKENLSIETQQIKILEKIEELGGYLAEDFYIDNGLSGTSTNRPGLQAFLARCAKKDISYLVVQDSSRISRNTYEYLYIKSKLKEFGVKIIPLAGIVDDDPISQTMDEMMAVVNALQPRLTSFKVKQTAFEKFKAGYYPSWSPLGYQNIVNPNPTGSYDKRIVVPDPIISPFITQAFKMYATRDYAIYDIRQYLHKNGVTGRKGKPLQYSIVGNMLRNPFYWGWMRHGGHEGMGKHQPLIDKNTFDLIQKVLTEKTDSGLRKRKHNFLLRGVVFCKDCGRRYVAEYHYRDCYKSCGGKLGMYHCSQTGKRGGCPSHAILLTDIEGQVRSEVAKLEFTDEFVKAVEANVTRVYEESIDRIKYAKKALENKRDGINQKRIKIEKDYFANLLSPEQLNKFNLQLDAEALAIQKEIAEQDKVSVVDTKVINDVIELTRNIVKTYEKSDTDHQRAYLHFFFQKIWMQNKKIVEVEYTPALQVLNEAKLGILSSNWLPLKDLFCNHKLESNFSLNDLKIAFQTLGLVTSNPKYSVVNL